MTQHISPHAVLRKRLHDRAGLLHRRRDFDLVKLAETQWSETFWRAMLSYSNRWYLHEKAEAVKLFETYMHNRLMMGAFRYGTFQEQRGSGRRDDNIPSVCRRWKRYQRTGNQELLVDCANLCLVEYVAPGSHPSPVGDLRCRVVCLGLGVPCTVTWSSSAPLSSTHHRTGPQRTMASTSRLPGRSPAPYKQFQ